MCKEAVGVAAGKREIVTEALKNERTAPLYALRTPAGSESGADAAFFSFPEFYAGRWRFILNVIELELEQGTQKW